MRRRLSARSRLTLLYTSLFAIGGAALVVIAYLLVLHGSHAARPAAIPRTGQPEIAGCVRSARTAPARALPSIISKCAEVFIAGAETGAAAQRRTTADQLLSYSLVGLAGVILLAALAGWVLAGRILRPVHRLTAAARAASEQDLSGRIALQGPRDELRELADTFDHMLERLEGAFASQRQFIANASHELRTPLTIMRTAIDVVLAKPEPTHRELVSMAADIRQAVDHSDRLIEVLLTLARSDQTSALADPLDLAAVAEDALEGRTTSDITITAALDEAPVTGDRMLLERLIVNLLDNAEQYNIRGGTIKVSTGHEDDTCLIRVINTGHAIPPEQIDRLLLPFTRLNNRTRHHGFGLGLALVSSIAAVHSGTVHATARPTGGLDITVRIPRRDSKKLDHRARTENAQEIGRFQAGRAQPTHHANTG